MQFMHLLLLPWLHFINTYFDFYLGFGIYIDLYVEVRTSNFDSLGERILLRELVKEFLGILLLKILPLFGWEGFKGGLYDDVFIDF